MGPLVPPATCGRLAALEITALSTCVSVGGMPHDRHGGICVCAFSDSGSKLDGTGFEKLQMGHTHVAAAVGGGPRRAVPLPVPRGEPELLRARPGPTPEADRVCSEDRFAGLGKRVTFGDDLMKPACRSRHLVSYAVPIFRLASTYLTYRETNIEFISLDLLELHGRRVPPRVGLIDVADAVRGQVDLAILLVEDLVFSRLSASTIRTITTSPVLHHSSEILCAATHPSYSPTLSCTNSRSSSGRYRGRSAVVRSSCFRDIRHIALGRSIPSAWPCRWWSAIRIPSCCCLRCAESIVVVSRRASTDGGVPTQCVRTLAINYITIALTVIYPYIRFCASSAYRSSLPAARLNSPNLPHPQLFCLLFITIAESPSPSIASSDTQR